MTLYPGMRGDNVRDLQRLLNAHGYGLDEDGIYGSITKNAVMDYQRRHGLKIDGIAGIKTLTRLMSVTTEPEPVTLSDASIQLILDYEVGGGENYYNRFLSRPTWPEGQSGVTIGIGFDLGYEPSLDPWLAKTPVEILSRLQRTMGMTGREAMIAVQGLRDIVIPWDDAYSVFTSYTLPTEIEKTMRVFPGLRLLPDNVQGALVSLVFNRGAGLKGDSRAEMRDIRDMVATGDIQGIADAVRRMKRLWPDVKGLRRRRDAEADFIEAAL